MHFDLSHNNEVSFMLTEGDREVEIVFLEWEDARSELIELPTAFSSSDVERTIQELDVAIGNGALINEEAGMHISKVVAGHNGTILEADVWFLDPSNRKVWY
jgi:hypothetical protein